MSFYPTVTTERATSADFVAPWSETRDAAFEQAWITGPLQSAIDRTRLELERSRTGTFFGAPTTTEEMRRGAEIYGLGKLDEGTPPRAEKLPRVEAELLLKEWGIEGQLKIPADGIGRGELFLLAREKRAEMLRKATLSRASDDIGTNIGTFIAGLAANVVDPVNAASAFIPVVGPTRYAWSVARAGSLLGRTAARLRIGAAEGVAGAALVEPLIYSTQAEYQRDYGPLDSFMNIVMGGATGAALHGLGGALRERVGPQTQQWRSMAEWLAGERSWGREFGARPPASLDEWRAYTAGRDLDGELPAMTRRDYEAWLREFGQRPYEAPRRLSDEERAAWSREFAQPPFLARPYAALGRFEDASIGAVELVARHMAEGRILDDPSAIYRYDAAEGRMRRHYELTEGQMRDLAASVTPETVQPMDAAPAPGRYAERFGLPVEGGRLPEAVISTEPAPGDSIRWVRADGTDRLAGPATIREISSDGRYVYVDTATGRQKGGIPADEIQIVAPTADAGRKWNIDLHWGDESLRIADGADRKAAERMARGELARFIQTEMGGRSFREAEVRRAGEDILSSMGRAERPEADLFYREPSAPEAKGPAETVALESREALEPVLQADIQRIKQAADAGGQGDAFAKAMEVPDRDIAEQRSIAKAMKAFAACLLRGGGV